MQQMEDLKLLPIIGLNHRGKLSYGWKCNPTCNECMTTFQQFDFFCIHLSGLFVMRSRKNTADSLWCIIVKCVKCYKFLSNNKMIVFYLDLCLKMSTITRFTKTFFSHRFLSGEEKIGGVTHLYKRMTKKEIKASSQLGKELDEEVRAEHTIL